MNILKTTSLFAVIAVATSSCSTYKYKATDKVYKETAKSFAKVLSATPPTGQSIDSLNNEQFFVGTTNMSMRKPNYVMIHHTAQDSLAQTIKTFTLTRTAVSSHYVVSRDGKVVQMVNDYLRAQHAGAGKWGSVTDMNSCSIGIEMDNNGRTDPWTDAQITSLISLLKTLKTKYNVPTANFIGHADYAPGRKNDPKNFPWKKLAEQGFGLWYDDVLETVPENFDPMVGLKVIGYNITKPENAIDAFKIRYVQNDPSRVLTEFDKQVIYNLYKKSL